MTSKIVSLAKTIKNNWKKCAFGATALAYGVSYGHNKYKIQLLMRKYCDEASLYGRQTEPANKRIHHVTVLLNPTANKRSALETYENYCAPILHLAGIAADVLQTDSEGHARRYIEDLENIPDALIVAGGDGIISEAVTGLLRRDDHENCTIGILPTGRLNNTARKLFNYLNATSIEEKKSLAEAAIAIVRGKSERKDVMKIEVLPSSFEKENINNNRPIYTMNSFHWGAYRDAISLRDKYWYFGPLRDYASILFNAFTNDLTWSFTASVTYSEPCMGCKYCYISQKIKSRNNNTNNKKSWLGFMWKSNLEQPVKNIPTNFNENCKRLIKLNVNTSECLIVPVEQTENQPPKLMVKLGEENISSFDFILNSWSRLWSGGISNEKPNFFARTIEILPKETEEEEDSELYFGFDNEAYEVKPIRITILPKMIQIYVV